MLNLHYSEQAENVWKTYMTSKKDLYLLSDILYILQSKGKNIKKNIHLLKKIEYFSFRYLHLFLVAPAV